MNEFAAGSAITTHGFAGSQRTGLYGKDCKEITSDAVLELMMLLSWESRGQECQKSAGVWPNRDTLHH